MLKRNELGMETGSTIVEMDVVKRDTILNAIKKWETEERETPRT
jgi:hypothetical protein